MAWRFGTAAIRSSHTEQRNPQMVEKNLKAIYIKARELADAKTKAQIQKTIEEELKKIIVLRQEVERERGLALKKIPQEDSELTQSHLNTLQNLMSEMQANKEQMEKQKVFKA